MTPETLVILGVPFHNMTFADTVAWAIAAIRGRRPAYLATANLDFVMQAWRDPELQRILIEAGLVIADGQPIVWLARLLGPRLRERVTGSDLTPMLAEAARDHGFSVFALGGAPGVADRATAALRERYPGLRVAGSLAPPKADLLALDNDRILAALDQAQPDLLLIAFGAPKQEKWANMHLRKWRVPLAIGVGGTLDFLAGAQRRAPRWLQRLGAEWLWRLGTDPRRLFGRYAANFGFLAAALVRLAAVRAWPAGRCVAPASPPTAADLAAWPAAWLTFVPHPRTRDGQEACVAAVAAAAPERAVILDLRAATWLSSRELGTLLAAACRCRARGSRLLLVNVARRVARLLRLYRLDRHLGIVADPARLAATCADVAAQRQAAGTARRELPDTLVFALPQELTVANVAAVRQLFLEALAREQAGGTPPHTVRFDVAALEFLDSSGLGFLIAQRQQLGGQGLTVYCTAFHGAARRTVEIARAQKLLLGVAAQP